ncbi:MAG: type VI secretion system lipoprotein TssJ [Desulfuromonadales bacterium]
MKPARRKLAVVPLLLLCSCSMFSSSPKVDGSVPARPPHIAVSPPPVEYKKGGITLNIAADPQLNRYKNSPHTLLICFYQLKDPNAFNQLADDQNSLAKLMECGKFDASVTYTKRFIVQPGQTLSEQRDLAEGTRFFGLAAGYYSQGTEKTTHLAPIATGLSSSTMSVNIELGPNEISHVTVK